MAQCYSINKESDLLENESYQDFTDLSWRHSIEETAVPQLHCFIQCHHNSEERKKGAEKNTNPTSLKPPEGKARETTASLPSTVHI